MSDSLKFFFGIFICAELASAQMSLQEAIKTSFERNPISLANDLRLEAAKERAVGAKLDMLPSGNVSWSKNFNHSNSESGGIAVDSKSRNRSWSVGLSMNVYRGGADWHTAQAAEGNVKALAAMNNSTDSLSPQTRGALANEVFGTYISLIGDRFQIDFYKQKIQIFKRMMKVAQSADEKRQIEDLVSEIDTLIIQYENGEIKRKKRFEYLVKAPCPAHLQSADEIAKGLLIPATGEEAFAVALEKSPELRRAIMNLEIAGHNRAAQRARSYSPSVDVSIQKNAYDSFAAMDSRSRGTYAGVTVSFPFGASTIAYNNATTKEVEALSKDFDRIRDHLRYDLLQEYYPTLINAISLDRMNRERYTNLLVQLDEVLKRIESGQVVKMEYALSLISQVQNQYMNTMSNQQNIAGLKFDIQKTIGTLFENVGVRLDPLGVIERPLENK